MREAIILAGGFGTRLQSVVKEVPKPMALVNGRPFLSYLLDLLCEYGIRRSILAVGYKHQVIKEYYGADYLSMGLEYSVEEEPLGTGGAIKQALSGVETDQIFVLNGDTYFNVNMEELLTFHREKEAETTIALKRMYHFDRFGSIEVDATGRIRGFTEKRYQESGYVNGGMYVLDKNYFLGLQLPAVFSFEHDFLARFYPEAAFYGYPSEAYFIDIGIPGDYEKARKHFNSTQ